MSAGHPVAWPGRRTLRRRPSVGPGSPPAPAGGRARHDLPRSRSSRAAAPDLDGLVRAARSTRADQPERRPKPGRRAPGVRHRSRIDSALRRAPAASSRSAMRNRRWPRRPGHRPRPAVVAAASSCAGPPRSARPLPPGDSARCAPAAAGGPHRVAGERVPPGEHAPVGDQQLDAARPRGGRARLRCRPVRRSPGPGPSPAAHPGRRGGQQPDDRTCPSDATGRRRAP